VKVTEERQVRKAIKLKGYTRFANEWKVGKKEGSAFLITFYGKPSNEITIKRRHSSKRVPGTTGKLL
jgi:hypothetical protein